MKKALHASLAFLALSGLISNSAQAQAITQKEIADLAVKHSEALVVNREVLKSYSNNYRVEVSKDGQLQWIDLINVQLDPSQKPIITQVNRDQITPQERGVFSERRQIKGFEEMDRMIAYSLKWITYYNRLPADRIFTLFRQAAQNGTYSVAPYSDDVIGVWSTNVRDSDANDKVTLWFNKQNGHPIRFAFIIPVVKSSDGATEESINVMTNYRYLKNGEAFYPDHIDVTIPSRNMRIKIEHLVSQKKP